jgi:hypothetical protein
MTQANHPTDPVVEILRLAYRRGLAIQREQEEKSKEIKLRPIQGEILTAERKILQTIIQKDYSHK